MAVGMMQLSLLGANAGNGQNIKLGGMPAQDQINDRINGLGADGANNFISDFTSVLAAILAGLNNSLTNNSGTFDIEALTKGLSVESDGKVMADGDIAGILQQMMAQMQMPGFNTGQNSGLNICPCLPADAEAVKGAENLLAKFSFPAEGEGTQKVKIHALSANGNSLLQVKSQLTGEDANLQAPNTSNSSLNKADGLTNAAAQIYKNAADKSESLKQLFQATALKAGSGDNASIKEIINAEEKDILSNSEALSGKNGVLAAYHNTAHIKEGAPIKETVHVGRLNEISEPIMKTIGDGDKHLIIKLEPPDLGNIQIKLKMVNGVLSADFKVDSNTVKDLFATAIPQIKASLEDSGIKVNDFSVDLREDYYSGERPQADDYHRQQQGHRKNKNFKFDYFA
jgi:hypothetical protein